MLDLSPRLFPRRIADGGSMSSRVVDRRCGKLLAFRIDPSMMNLLRGGDDVATPAAVALAKQIVRPALCVNVAGGAAAWQIIVSRNGKFLLINSADCTLRLYNVEELSSEFDAPSPVDAPSVVDAPSLVETRRNDDAPRVQPRFVFQDNISKAPWASCDFYNGEYVCGGSNSYPQPGDNYKLFLWNCITGELVDQLTGPVSSLYSLSCHPTRPFIAVGTSDGLVDVWGARLDWVAFAPDFQRLEQNELYEEREDEFDTVVDDDEEGEGVDAKCGSAYCRLSEGDDVDIMTVGKVPAFDSDSEDEKSVFYFGTKVEKIVLDKQTS
jgi:WD40 repeat protein